MGKHFQCGRCDLTFGSHKEYADHVKTHFNQVPRRFKCLKCEKSYTTKQNLLLHMNSAHNTSNKKSVVFNCHFCSKSFHSYKDQKIHTKFGS